MFLRLSCALIGLRRAILGLIVLCGPRLRRRKGGFPRPFHMQRVVPCQCRRRMPASTALLSPARTRLADHAALEFNSGSDALVDDVVVPDEAGRTAEVETE
jgi:hypothetical protein